MRIDKLELQNFRNFEQKVVHFSPHFTVIIGENGKGKSSILQGLRLAAASFLLGIEDVERYHIQKEDVRRIERSSRFVPLKDCSFSATGVVVGQSIGWKRTLSRIGGKTDYKQATDIIELAKSLNDRINRDFDDDVDMPVIGYFSTARLWVDSKQTVKLKKKGFRLMDGYARCVDDRCDKKSPMEWIKSGTWKKLKDKPESVLLDAVLEAIDICIPHWTPTEWDEDADDLGGVFEDSNGEKYYMPLFYLSDGIRTMAAMVAEIAYRCAVLNPHHGRDVIRKSHGIVLIDEIDMHLHPKWQQHVVEDLKKAFPNIQFIATTHSPFIVQSLESDELINLDDISDVEPVKLPIQDVASYIMKVEPRSLKYKRKFDRTTEYLETLNQTDFSETKKFERLDQMEEEGMDDPAFSAFLKMNRLAQSTNNDEK